jgi:transcriptional regulator with XRE-family HTH domain
MTRRSQRYSTEDNVDIGHYVAEKLKFQRELKGLTQKEVIYKANLRVTQQIYSKYENGDIRVPSTVLYLVAGLLNVKIDDFFPNEVMK